ncbi:MAG: TonB-dependent siderophore receptor [Pseudomonadota bacterium]
MSEISKTAFIPLATKAKNNRFSNLLTSTVIVGVALTPGIAIAKENETTTLPTVTVIDSRENENYNATESSFYKLNGPLVDQPRSVTTVTRQLMNDQGTTKVSDALRNVPGISLAAGEGGNQGDNITIRGFSARSDFFVDGMRDFGSYYRDAFNLDSIDVVQGSSSILFGRGSAGGVVQQNSKQAYLGSLSAGSLMLGTNDLARATVDVNQKITGLEGAAIRVNAMAHTNKVAERDNAAFRRNAIAPTLAFGLGTDNRLNISHLHQNENNTPDYGIPFYAGEPANTDRKNFYGFKNDYLKTTVDISTIKFEHDFSKDLSLRNQTRYARYSRDTQITNPSTTDGSTVTRSMIIRKSLDTYLGNQTDLTNKFSTMGVEHNLITGLAIESESAAPNNFTATAASTTLQDPISSLFSAASTFNGVTKTKVDTIGVYLLDTVKLSPSWELSLGARYDNMRTNYDNLSAANVRTILSQTSNVLSYNAGIVYKPAKNGSIYFNHGTSFNPSSESLSLSATTTNLDPEKNVSYEVGTKWDLFKKRLTTNAAVFRTIKDNARETVNGVGVLSGTQQVTGFLLQASGKITEKWNIMTGYTFMDGKVTKSLVSDAYENRALTNTPEHMFNLFTTYKFDSQLEVGAGANFVSERFVSPTTAVDTTTGTVRNVPSYIVFNAMAKYPLSKNVDLQVNVNNITNEFFYDQLRGSNSAVPGEGRVLLLSTNVKF